MSSRVGLVALRIALVLLATGIGFVFLQAPSRHVEAWAAASLVELGDRGKVQMATDTSIVVYPDRGSAFRALVTPSCSAVSSVLALACLASVSGRAARARTLGAVSLAVATVALGNVVRIAASLVVGVYAGRAALVLFHDWVGSVFAFAYTLGGYILMLYVLLSGGGRAARLGAPVDVRAA